MRLFVIFLALLCLGQSTVWGQRSRNRKADKKEKVSVEALMDQYRFEEAIERLEEDIAAAAKRKKPTEEMEAKLERARSLSVMLSGTEKVYFIDSVVVDKQKFLSAMHFGQDCGTVAKSASLLPKELRSSRLGEVAYRNELGDKLYFSQKTSSGISGLFVSESMGGQWSKPKALNGVAAEGAIQDYPYVLSDGVTLYYADQKEEGLGGYDIYVTRYNAENDEYLKAENIGMPFNSPANDYMYVLDEANRLGWFVSDRYQPKDKVCIYIFQPSDTRQVYNPVAVGMDWLRDAARLQSIRKCMLNKEALAKAKARLQQVMEEPTTYNRQNVVRYVINDKLVYTSLLQFKHDEAQRLAIEWAKEKEKLDNEEKRLENMRSAYQKDHASAEEKSRLLQQESLVYGKRVLVNDLAKKMRKAELKK